MGYYADLEVEEVLKETMKIERTAKKEPLEALQTTFTKGFKKEEDRATIVNSFIEQSLGFSKEKRLNNAL
jgi:hypothetical protein